MKKLGEAVNSALSESEQIARAVDGIKEAGYEIFVMFETTLGVRKQSEESSKETLAFDLDDPNPTIADDQLQQFMKELREAVKSELDSEQIVRAATPIKENGYQPFVTLETNIRIRRQRSIDAYLPDQRVIFGYYVNCSTKLAKHVARRCWRTIFSSHRRKSLAWLLVQAFRSGI